MSWLLLAAACSGDPRVETLRVGPGSTSDEVKADDTSDSGPQAELKVMVDDDAIDEVREALGLEDDLAEVRDIYFYDSLDLALFEAGAILRARNVHDDDDDSTVKIRPLVADEVDPSWFEQDGFKCELDASPHSSVESCSFTVEQDEEDIDEVADGDRDLDSLFSSEQEYFLAEHGPYFYWDELAVLGPVDALVWKIESDLLPSKLTAEHWRLPNEEEMLEVSIKVAVADREDGMSQLLDWLADHEVPLSDGQETKTRRALEVLSEDASSSY